MQVAQTLGWLATIIYILSYIPQILKSKKGKELSLIYITLYLAGTITALTYSILINQRPLQIKYTAEIILVVTINYYAYHNFKQFTGKNANPRRRSNKS
jgi:uncharacterized protein with PQ loop repeat